MKTYRLILIVLLISVTAAVSQAQAQKAVAGAVNVSVLVTLAPGGTATLGFVVGALPAGQTVQWYLVRAVGPSLAQFGTTNLEPQPTVTLFGSNGSNITPSSYIIQPNWSATFALAGAFPLLNGALDYSLVIPLGPGTYTAQVSDASGKGGTVLIEAYASPGVVFLQGPE